MLYIVKDENRLYRWDDSAMGYFCVGSDYNEIVQIIADGVLDANNNPQDLDDQLDDPELP